MERQLANLTGLVQKALTQQPAAPPVTQSYLGVTGQFRGGEYNTNDQIKSTNCGNVCVCVWTLL